MHELEQVLFMRKTETLERPNITDVQTPALPVDSTTAGAEGA